MGPLLQATRTIPILFTAVADPVAGGFVASLARPGGNATGFTSFEYSLGGKWPELLKQIAPGRNARGGAARSYPFAGGRAVRSHPGGGAVLGMELSPVDVRNVGEIERAITAFAQELQWRV